MPSIQAQRLFETLEKYYEVCSFRSNRNFVDGPYAIQPNNEILFGVWELPSLNERHKIQALLREEFELKVAQPLRNKFIRIEAGEMDSQQIDKSIEKIQQATCKIKGIDYQEFLETQDQAQFQKSVQSYTQRLKNEMQAYASQEKIR